MNVIGFSLGSVVMIYQIEYSLKESVIHSFLETFLLCCIGYILALLLYTLLIKKYMHIIFLPKRKPRTNRIHALDHRISSPVRSRGNNTPQLVQESDLVVLETPKSEK
jgi:dipeptide/tripeptide permease